MKSKLLYLFTRTPLHVGAGASVGAIDQPIQRERHTGFPIIPGSSIKGVIRDAANQLDYSETEIDDTFGPEDSTDKKSDKITRAGNVSFTEARILAFPVRSAKGAFAYITCPFLLSRFKALTGNDELPEPPNIGEQECAASPGLVLNGEKVVLEEYCFTSTAAPDPAWITALRSLVPDPVWQTVSSRLAILSDGDFSHFVKTTTEISNHNRINAETGTVDEGALFNLESVPAETLFLAQIHFIGRKKASAKKNKDSEGQDIYTADSEAVLTDLISKTPLLQFGGASTTGRGFCSLKLS